MLRNIFTMPYAGLFFLFFFNLKNKKINKKNKKKHRLKFPESSQSLQMEVDILWVGVFAEVACL